MNDSSHTVIRVGMFSDPPYSYGIPTEANGTTGIASSFLYMFCQMSNITCLYYNYSEGDYGYETNGTWHGMVNEIKNDVYDLSFPFFTPTTERLKIIDFSDPVTYEPIYLVTRSTFKDNNLNLLSSLVFDWSSWLLLILFSIVIGLLISITQMTKLNSNSCSKLIFNCIDIFSFLTDQGNVVNTRRLGIRFVIGFWGLAVVVLTGVYCGKLTSSLITNNGSKLPFYNFESFVQCIETAECRFLLPNSYLGVISEISNSQSEINIRLTKALRSNPVITVASYRDALFEILNDESYYSAAMMGQIAFMFNSHSNKNCIYSTVEYSNDILAFPIRKNSIFKGRLNAFVSQMNQNGLFNGLLKKFALLKNNVENNCRSNNFNKNDLKINVFQFFSCLFVLLVGIFISLTALLFEIVKKWFQTKLSFH